MHRPLPLTEVAALVDSRRAAGVDPIARRASVCKPLASEPIGRGLANITGKRGGTMKITNIETYPVWGGHRNFLFVVVDTDEGIYGVGEAGITGRELAVIGAIEHFKPLLIGQDPARIEHLWQLLSRGGFFPAQRILTAAISAIDIALWDIKGKALGVPIYDLLGGRVRDRVVCYPHNVGHSKEVGPLVES